MYIGETSEGTDGDDDNSVDDEDLDTTDEMVDVDGWRHFSPIYFLALYS